MGCGGQGTHTKAGRVVARLDEVALAEYEGRDPQELMVFLRDHQQAQSDDACEAGSLSSATAARRPPGCEPVEELGDRSSGTEHVHRCVLPVLGDDLAFALRL